MKKVHSHGSLYPSIIEIILIKSRNYFLKLIIYRKQSKIYKNILKIKDFYNFYKLLKETSKFTKETSEKYISKEFKEKFKLIFDLF